MEQELEVQVKIVSKETVTPSIPPPNNPEIFTLSLLDQINPIFHVPVLLFYSATNTTPQCEPVIDISGLKTSLSQTLDHFYPLAGRLLDDNEFTVSCNHQGIPFIETQVDSRLSDVLTSAHKLKLLTKFLPPPEFQALRVRPISELVPLAIQVNVFLCGGMVIGCYMLHRLLDATSLANFLNYWAALASKRFKDLVQPDFEASIKAFPPLPREKHNDLPTDFLLNDPPPSQSNNPITTVSVLKSFVFDNIAIRKLKVKATSNMVPNPTRFEAVAGFIWEHVFATARNLGVQAQHTALSYVVNLRRKMSPPLPREAMGNLITTTFANAAKGSSFQELVKEIHSVLPKVNPETTTSPLSIAVKSLSDRIVECQNILQYQEGVYWLSSWCKVGFEDVDFGFGKPVWIVPSGGRIHPPTIRNVIIFTDYKHHITGDEVIEAWLLLEEKEMQVLGSDPNFLAFASPN